MRTDNDINNMRPLGEQDIFCPAAMVDNATPASAPEIANILVEMLSDEALPEEMRRDMRARLATLYHRFAESFDAEETAYSEDFARDERLRKFAESFDGDDMRVSFDDDDERVV